MTPSFLYAKDRYYLLNEARAAADQGEKQTAIDYYLKYIGSHPAVTGKKTGAYKKNAQYYLRNLLIAFSNLTEIQRGPNETGTLQMRLEKLDQVNSDNWLGSKNLFNLARIYSKNGATESALSCLTWIVSDQNRSPRKTNNKVFVRACDALLEIYQAGEMDAEKESIIRTLHGSLEKLDYDLKDRYRIGRILVEFGAREKGEAVLKDIVAGASRESLETEEHAVVRALVKLLKLKSSNSQVTNRLLTTLDAIGEGVELSPRNQYSLGIACLNAGQKKRGLLFLKNLKATYPESNYARRSLFVLARTAASASRWDQAIRYYSDYINRYPEPRFFSLKAYSRLIDCHWAKYKNPDLVESEVRELADIANDIADFETQLNLARDLKAKGFDDLAEATFDLGVIQARNHLEADMDKKKRLRLLWLLQKYSFPLGKYSQVEEFGIKALEIIGRGQRQNLPPTQKVKYFHSQTYIWLAQSYLKRNRPAEAEKAYLDFLTKFPESRDVDYVRFALAELYEKKGEVPRAKGLYKKVGGGVWKDRAVEKLEKQGKAQ